MQNKCELIEKSAQQVLTIRTRAAVEKLPQVLGIAYGNIMQYMGELGENPSDAPFVAYYNMDMQDLDIDVGVPVSSQLQGKGDIKSSEIPAGKHAICIYKGPYSGSEGAYNEMTQYMTENGLTPTGIVYEYYLNDPKETPENELLTRIDFPLK